MQEENIDSLYEIIVKNSWNDYVDNYYTFIIENAKKLSNSDEETILLIDKTLKKILLELKNNVMEDVYDNIVLNLGSYSNQDGYDFAVGLIRSFYRDEFKINGKEYSTLDIMYNIYEQYKSEDTLEIPEIFHYILASLFRLHYALYTKDKK